ncbi:hypothetical protein GCM10008171_22140 [Methylopila jiangsuensis]|uniref:tRNA(Ile)-lysidine synthase n=1 Tax=Methylopila jiangsuensis TaxID=586230 RepID=A0A9W6N443_9HYPH|nr:tRNA lysidine(34) synthetase TilS [Methylopila jiangsuensis]MDR6286696.1 tRNA(Ile)-lysidine synthase [Methylopila jiangsuensis]GLK76960.1 hypothetical protein GCM10008171_22140 [Methylopila jiangsuensis]
MTEIAVSDSAPTPAETAALFDAAFAGLAHILLAVSGGADSTAMLALAAQWAQARGGVRLSVATVDQGLRPEAADEAGRVAALSARLGLPHAALDGRIEAGARLEERARAARYAALEAHAAAIGADGLATAHTLDDQAETVLMRLAAGSGPAGLAAMRPHRRREGGLVHARPLLSVPRRRLIAALQARGMTWAEDPMNADPAFLRARLRAARAVLEAEGLTAERLGLLAARMARLDEAAEAAVDAAAAAHLTLGEERAALDAGAAALPAELRLRLLGRAVAAVAGDAPVRLDRLERLHDRIADEPAGAATLAGVRIAWRNGAVDIAPAPPRRPRGG